jgi:hypothetical protein
MKNMDFFTDRSLALDAAKDTSQAMVMAGYQIGRNFIECVHVFSITAIISKGVNRC